MAFRAAASTALFGVAAAGACTSDEQAALADPQVVGQKANDCGVSSFNVITGNFDHDKFDACLMKELGISKACAECYAISGEYGSKNCKADCLLGWCKSGCLSCTAPAQKDLATCTGFPTPTADPCDELKEEVRGACTTDEQHLLSDPETVGQKANDCGVSSFNVITGNFDHDKFDACLMGGLGISKACAECYAISGEYGAKNCKADCLLGWCKSGCLSCTAPAQKDLATCTGFPTPTADPCDELKQEVRGACTTDEQHLLSDPETVGQKANDCGVSSFNVITGNFDHDKFDACLMKELGISKACAECYAISGEYGAKNCKADCLLGWCKSGCLSCTAPAQKDLATCTGFPTPTADPCEEATV